MPHMHFQIAETIYMLNFINLKTDLLILQSFVSIFEAVPCFLILSILILSIVHTHTHTYKRISPLYHIARFIQSWHMHVSPSSITNSWFYLRSRNFGICCIGCFEYKGMISNFAVTKPIGYITNALFTAVQLWMFWD